MQSQNEVAAGLERRFTEVTDWFASQPDESFCQSPPERWTQGQQLKHLIQSTKPLNMALRLPRLVLRLKFGLATGAGESLEGVSARYEGVLADGGKAGGAFIPPPIELEAKPHLLETLGREGTKLVEVVGKWRESDLDKYVLPHPLLGNLSIRDMLFFTYHHMGHHLETLERDYT